jgi:hypothetical protein
LEWPIGGYENRSEDGVPRVKPQYLRRDAGPDQDEGCGEHEAYIHAVRWEAVPGVIERKLDM